MFVPTYNTIQIDRIMHLRNISKKSFLLSISICNNKERKKNRKKEEKLNEIKMYRQIYFKVNSIKQSSCSSCIRICRYLH